MAAENSLATSAHFLIARHFFASWYVVVSSFTSVFLQRYVAVFWFAAPSGMGFLSWLYLRTLLCIFVWLYGSFSWLGSISEHGSISEPFLCPLSPFVCPTLPPHCSLILCGMASNPPFPFPSPFPPFHPASLSTAMKLLLPPSLKTYHDHDRPCVTARR